MPLSEPAPRRHFHTRNVTVHGYRLDGGGWDIEGHLTDTKGYDYTEHFRGPMPAGRPVHNMHLRLTLNDTLEVIGVEAATDHAPYGACFQVAPNFKALEGLRVGSGWRKEVRRRLGGTAGCTHLVEMLDVMGTVTFQTTAAGADPTSPDADKVFRNSDKRKFLIDSCKAWAGDGELVRDRYPDLYAPKSK